MTALSTKTFDAVNPATGEMFSQIPDMSVEEIRQVIQRARHGFDTGPWKDFSFAERGIYLKKIAKLVRTHAKELADLEIKDVGKTSKHASLIDIPTAADCFEYFSSVSCDDKENPVNGPVNSRSIYQPRGVVAAICSYNYPMIYAAWKIAPAIIAGNCVILKPSPLASASIHRLGQLLEQVGLPDGVVNIVTTTSNEVAEELVVSEAVDMISFTGSGATGQRIMALAAQRTKKVVLELGGKSPNIVFADCNLEAALGGALSAIFINQGQMCTAGSRLFVHEDIYDSFVERLVQRTRELRVGDPQKAATEIGPLTSRDHRDYLLSVIDKAVKAGAHLECGGKAPDGPGYYLEPTILTAVTNEMDIAQNECFGPILAVIKFNAEDDVVRQANDSRYGLAACVWTKDEVKAERVARKLEAGTVWVNTYGNFFNEAPFGGTKQSGFGRELGPEGLKEYMQVKHVCVDQTPGGMPLAASWF